MRLRAPSENRSTLSVPESPLVPDAIRANQRLFKTIALRIAGIPLHEIRQNARQQLGCADAEIPLLVSGHQPELSHPGVWAKHFALNHLAKHVQGIPLNLIVDHDTMKSASIVLPTWKEWQANHIHQKSIPFDDFLAPQPYESRHIANPDCFTSFADRVLEASKIWGFTPSIGKVWKHALALHATASIGQRFSHMRIQQEREWGCENLEYHVSELSQTEAFQFFAQDIIQRAESFRACYNSAVRDYRKKHKLKSQSHPVPELEEGELPFWSISRDERTPIWSISRDERTPSMAHGDHANIRPRALTLTLFARLFFADYFIHGLGGGKYDEVTDTIIANFYGIEPPAFQILTATLHLPLARFPATPSSVRDLKLAIRARTWNPELFTDKPEDVVAEKQNWIAKQPETRKKRRERYRKLQELNAALQPYVHGDREAACLALDQAHDEVRANAILQRRDYAWLLYPEELLREFLQGM